MTALTPEAFLALPPDPEDDSEETRLDQPLVSIAESLRTLVGMVQDQTANEKAEDRLHEAYDDLEAKHEVVLELVEDIKAIIKPSTSKLANSVRDAITAWAVPGYEPVDPAPEHEVGAPASRAVPAHDAPVEAWRNYARHCGADHTADLDQLNRSQIRTLLGIEHGGEQS